MRRRLLKGPWGLDTVEAAVGAVVGGGGARGGAGVIGLSTSCLGCYLVLGLATWS
jgi:hypothetical protein